MKHIATYDEKFVNNTIFFVEEATGGEFLYVDKECKTKVTKDQLLEAAEAGPIIVFDLDEEEYIAPMKVSTVDDTYGTISVLELAQAGTGSFISFVTEEYSAE